MAILDPCVSSSKQYVLLHYYYFCAFLIASKKERKKERIDVEITIDLDDLRTDSAVNRRRRASVGIRQFAVSQRVAVRATTAGALCNSSINV